MKFVFFISFLSVVFSLHIGNNVGFVPKKLQVNLKHSSYPIYIGEKLDIGDCIRNHIQNNNRIMIVSNTIVAPLYLEKVKSQFKMLGCEVSEVILEDGEKSKSMENVLKIIDSALLAKLDRKSTLVALGGGVIGDLTGFAASIFQRGIKYVQIPTTLLAMVDSSVGGKTAVNHEFGKNMIGTFHQPSVVVSDISFLSSLPKREYISGISEIIKHGLIRNEMFFIWLESNANSIRDRDALALTECIYQSCLIKSEIVKEDENEESVRAILNFGHTFGHAIESILGHGTWLHGEAVALGMIFAIKVSLKHNWISLDIYNRIYSILKTFGLPLSLHNNHYDNDKQIFQNIVASITDKKFLDYMSRDKKTENKKMKLILMKEKIGNCVITQDFDMSIVIEVINEILCDKQSQ